MIHEKYEGTKIWAKNGSGEICITKMKNFKEKDTNPEEEKEEEKLDLKELEAEIDWVKKEQDMFD